MLKFEGFEIGDRIRAHDFNPAWAPGQALYVEGRVVGIVDTPFKAYIVMVDHDSAAALFSLPARITVLVPMELGLLDYDHRVRRLPEPDRPGC